MEEEEELQPMLDGRDKAEYLREERLLSACPACKSVAGWLESLNNRMYELV